MHLMDFIPTIDNGLYVLFIVIAIYPRGFPVVLVPILVYKYIKMCQFKYLVTNFSSQCQNNQLNWINANQQACNFSTQFLLFLRKSSIVLKVLECPKETSFNFVHGLSYIIFFPPNAYLECSKNIIIWDEIREEEDIVDN